MSKGQIIESGGPELVQELEDAGYDPVLARHGIEGAEEVIADGR
jgi:Fe-S cluster assembly ATPase SufC